MVARSAAQLPAVNRSVVIVTGAVVEVVGPVDLNVGRVGLKALGLLRLPAPWVPSFYVVSSDQMPADRAIFAAARDVGIGPDDEVLVRSSGTSEGMEERGSLETRSCVLRDVGKTIEGLQRLAAFQDEDGIQTIHFVIQKRVASRKLGHLANERRLQRHPRDWRFEIEGDGTSQSIGVRRWRDASATDLSPLECGASVLISGALRSAASWALPHRAHMEWVWDGRAVWMVQLDFLDAKRPGVRPADLVSHQPRPTIAANELKLFLQSSAEGLASYPKLKNARLYGKLGYSMPSFYVLRDKKTISKLLRDGAISEDLKRDLGKLCAYPFVLRTDASGLAPDQRQMLPRSDELRSLDAAVEWLQGPFKQAMSSLEAASDVVLLGHHYIPAVASAWSLASPDDRRVRIESLWGIPEGLYCFAYDVFDVDTMHMQLDEHDFESSKIIFKKEPYKGKFVAPNTDGEWIVQETAEGPDWSRSIRNDAWVKEIAWTSRRIAKEVGHAVVVMWFIGVSDSQELQSVMPWYHEEWKAPPAGGYKKAAPRTKRISAQIRNVASQRDWLKLREDVQSGVQVERVVIDPTDSSIIRARDFVKDLAVHAKQHGYVIELSGGVLSHFFYMLSKEGCNVECVDLTGVGEESVEFNKIVRDKIPDDIQGRGESVDVVELWGDALIEGLRRKLVEEALEVADALSADDMADELADVSEVIDALARALRVTKDEVRERQAKKRAKRGGFEKGLMLVRTSLPPTLRDGLEGGEPPPQRRSISDVSELPHHDVDFHVDHRIDASGSRERQLTMTLSAHDQRYSAGEHSFDLSTPKGDRHDMFFNARIDRTGSTLRLKVRLTNAALQLSLPFDSEDEANND